MCEGLIFVGAAWEIRLGGSEEKSVCDVDRTKLFGI